MNSVIIFILKTLYPQILKFQGGLCNESNYGECVSHPAVRSGEHIGISHLTNKSVQPRKNSAVYYNQLIATIKPRFNILVCHENKKYLLELEENLLIMRDRLSMNQNVRCLFYIKLVTICRFAIFQNACLKQLH